MTGEKGTAPMWGLRERIRKVFRSEQGAIAPLSAITLVIVIFAGALSVDVGQVVFGERRLEKIVDLAALDTAVALEGYRDAPALPVGFDPEAALTEAAKASMTRNYFDAEDTADNNSVTVEVGLSDLSTKTFTALPWASWLAANAVRVNGTTREDYHIAPFEGLDISEAGVARINVDDDTIDFDPCVGSCGGTNPCTGAGCIPPTGNPPCSQGDPTCTPPCDPALGQCPPPCTPGDAACPPLQKSDPVAAISVGSTLGSFSSRDSFMDPFLSEMLGATIDIDAAGYDGLASANLELGALLSELGLDLGDADEVLNTEVTLGDLLQAQADALNAEGDPNSVAAATALTTFASSVDSNLSVTLNELIDFGMGEPGMAAGAEINALELLTVAAEVANGTNLVSFDMPFTIPGVSNARVSLALIERPRMAMGPPGYDDAGQYLTVAKTAQARLFLDIDMTNGVNVGGVNVPLRMPIYIEAGQARSGLHTVDCDLLKDNCQTGVVSAVDAAGIYFGDVDLTAMIDGSQVVPISDGEIGSAAVVSITGSGSMTVSGTSKDSAFTGPHQNADGDFLRVDHLGTTGVELDALKTSMDINATGALGLGGAAVVEAQVSALMGPVFDQIEADILDPLVDTPLGVTIGGADVLNMDTICTYTTIAGV